jgi:membrane associated rhomboid family serine protease
MFVSYAFLHAGIWHLCVNMIVLVALGRQIIQRTGLWRFVGLYFACVIGGAIGFAILSSKLQPMIGASGALFGLIATKLLWDALDASHQKTPHVGTILRPTAIMLALNLGSYLLASGHLAWETHLGGTIASLFLAPLLRRWS